MASANGSTGSSVRIGLAVLFACGGALMTVTRAMHWDDPAGNQSRLAALSAGPADRLVMPGEELCEEPAPLTAAPVGGPPTRPSEPRGQGFGDRGRFSGGSPFFRPSTSKGPSTQPEPTAAEVAKFMEEHSPHKWSAFKAIPEQFREGALRGITARYKEMKRLEAEDQPGFAIELKQAHLEDEIFEAAVRYRAAKDKPQEQEAIKTATRAKVRDLSALFQEKRQHQLELVQTQIASLQSQVKELQASADWMTSDLEKSKLASADDVEKRIDRRTDDYLNPHRRWGGRGPGDRNPGGGDRPERFDRGGTTRPSREGSGGPGGPGRFGPPGPPPGATPE